VDSLLLLFNHRGDGEAERERQAPGRLAHRGSYAAFFSSSSAGDVRRRWPSCLRFLWPVGGPPQPRSGGGSTSRLQATSEDDQLRTKIPQRCCIKWFVPGVGIAAPAAEFSMVVRWRRILGTRLRFLFSLQGPCCKCEGLVCIFLFFLDLSVTCNPTTGI
jgi:hypothetical protein